MKRLGRADKVMTSVDGKNSRCRKGILSCVEMQVRRLFIDSGAILEQTMPRISAAVTLLGGGSRALQGKTGVQSIPNECIRSIQFAAAVLTGLGFGMVDARKLTTELGAMRGGNMSENEFFYGLTLVWPFLEISN